jgi:hypothetical protein
VCSGSLDASGVLNCRFVASINAGNSTSIEEIFCQFQNHDQKYFLQQFKLCAGYAWIWLESGCIPATIIAF